jgi:hypothetical protein
MSAIVPAAIVFFIIATSLMALFGCADIEPRHRNSKLSFGHDIAVIRARSRAN